MDNTFFKTGLRFYQSANADAQSIKDNFIIRNHEYDIIMDDMRRNSKSQSVQHYLLLGRRGSGKSTLLKRIQVEIDCNKQLKEKYIAINLAEEQANIYRLFDLLEDIHEELQHRGIAIDDVNPVNDPHEYARQLFAVLHSAISTAGKKLVLLLDNIDRIFENLGKDASLLRENLLNYSDIKIIGGSTRMTEHFWKYDMPFYNFFRELKLEPLTRDEVKQLMLHWADTQNLPALKEFIENRPGQLETVRILTDGLPRTLQFFVNLIINKGDATGYEYLRQIVDYMTPQYQERLNILPPSQRKIVLQLAFIWESTGAKELAEAARMENKVISAQLKQLADKGIVDKLETDTKNHLYRLSERFFNLWLIFTQGSPYEKRRARYLTVFLENFYDEEELRKVAEHHLNCLVNGKMPADKAAVLTKAIAQSKFITIGMRDALISSTLELKNIDNHLKIQLPEQGRHVLEEVKVMLNNHQWKAVYKKLSEIEQHDSRIEFIRGTASEQLMDLSVAEQHFLNAVDKYNEAKLSLAKLYYKQKKYDLAENYFLKAVDANLNEATIDTADFYAAQNKIDLAERFYAKAIENNEEIAKYRLAFLYLKENMKKELALSLIKDYYQSNKNKNTIPLLIFTKLWNGAFDDIRELFEIIIEAKMLDHIRLSLKVSLYFNQINLVISLFLAPNFGDILKSHFLPFYYAALSLRDDHSNLNLKIPPELENTVTEIMDNVRIMQEYYNTTRKK